MTGLLLPLAIVAVLALLLAVLVRSIDRAGLRERPAGLVSPEGLRLVVGGGFAVGLAWGLLTGWSEGAGVAVLRGLTVGLIAACGGAFYLGRMQRAGRR